MIQKPLFTKVISSIRIATFLLCLMGEHLYAQSASDSLRAKLKNIYAELNSVPGFAVGIVDTSGLIFSEGFGYADIENRVSYSPYHTQLLCSVSKTFIAVSTMKCIEQGLFDFNTPINDLLPFEVWNPYYPKDTIRVKHLLNHTSTIDDNGKIWKYEYWIKEPPTKKNYKFGPEEKKFFRGISQIPPVKVSDYLANCLKPNGKWYSKKYFHKVGVGKRYEYSNLGADLMAYIIEIAQQKKYSEYVIENIIEPLKMTNTGWKDSNTLDIDKRAKTYSYYGYEYPEVIYVAYPDGGIESSVKDMSKFVQDMILGLEGKGKILRSESYERMLQPSVMGNEPDSVCVFWDKNRHVKDYQHSGSSADANTLIGFNKSEKLGYVILCNHTLKKKDVETFMKVYFTLFRNRKKIAQEYHGL